MTEAKKSLYGAGVSPKESEFLNSLRFTHQTTDKVIRSVLRDLRRSPIKVADFGCGSYPLYTKAFAEAGTRMYRAFDKTIGVDGISVADTFSERYRTMPDTGRDVVVHSDGSVMKVDGVAADVTMTNFVGGVYDVVMMNQLLQHIPSTRAVDLVRELMVLPRNTIVISSYDWTPTFENVGKGSPEAAFFAGHAAKLFALVGSNPYFGAKQNLVNFAKSADWSGNGDDIETRFFDRPLGDYKHEVVPLSQSMLAVAKRFGDNKFATDLEDAINDMIAADTVELVPPTLSFLILR